MGNESTILLIEDEPEIRRFLRTTLPNQGYRLFEADTGQEGLAQAQARDPDLILLDLGLPDIDGLDIIKKLSVNGTSCRLSFCRRGAMSRSKSRHWMRERTIMYQALRDKNCSPDCAPRFVMRSCPAGEIRMAPLLDG